ncbi:MAG: FAD-dependent oxidoreductase, partial [Candidatus Thermoplasmatota archaeon]|nr:FAD-dependent oxidoreductase [Candidatus Thermoplasmatota archaeon]
MSEQHFDVLVLGGGSGLTATYWAEQAGRSIALVEPGPLGGTCVNRGCIPTKTLIQSAKVARTIRNAEAFGIHPPSGSPQADFQGIMKRMRSMRQDNVAHTQAWIEGSDEITWFKQHARFTGERTVEVGEHTLTADHVFVCTGARPRVPPIDGIEDVDHLTNREVLDELDHQPDHLIILGGGYIGLEFANFFEGIGTDVTVIDSSQCLTREDQDVREVVTQRVAAYTNLINGARATQVHQEDDTITLTVDRDGATLQVTGDALLVATG